VGARQARLCCRQHSSQAVCTAAPRGGAHSAAPGARRLPREQEQARACATGARKPACPSTLTRTPHPPSRPATRRPQPPAASVCRHAAMSASRQAGRRRSPARGSAGRAECRLRPPMSMNRGSGIAEAVSQHKNVLPVPAMEGKRHMSFLPSHMVECAEMYVCPMSK